MRLPRLEGAPTIGAVLAAAALASGVSAMVSPTAGAAPATPVPVVAEPPALEVLEQKMEQLQLTSERFTEIEQGTSSITLPGRGRRKPQTHTTHVFQEHRGDVSISPREGIVTSLTPVAPYAIETPSNFYLYARSIARSDHGRPWVRFDAKQATLFELFPFHGGSSDEVSRGGSGPYAGLINLIDTAVAPATNDGQTTVEGQQATEFTVPVDGLGLVKSSGLKEFATVLGTAHQQQLELFITEAGLPLRVVIASSSRTPEFSSSSTQTTEVTSINEPLTDVAPPPAEQTIGEKRFLKLLGPFGKLLPTVEAKS